MTKPASVPGKGPAILSGEERRRSQRVVIRISVTVQYTAAGHKVTFQATTVSVNDHGAMLLCLRPLDTEAKIEIQNDRTGEKQKCRVTRRPVETAEGFLIPVEFASSAPDFWHISFPPSNWKPLDS